MQTQYKLISENSHLTIDLNGGRITELVLGGKRILGTVRRIDGKMGNTHLCVPNFGSEGKDLNLPFHGPARSGMWHAEGRKNDSLTIKYIMPETGAYPPGLQIVQEFVIRKKAFEHKIIATNAGTKALPVNIGIHNYWVMEKGWEGISVNGFDISSLVRTNGNIPLQKENSILSSQGNIMLSQAGFADAVVWTAFRGPVFDTGYVCIEPVRSARHGYFGSSDSMLASGEHITLSQEIRI